MRKFIKKNNDIRPLPKKRNWKLRVSLVFGIFLFIFFTFFIYILKEYIDTHTFQTQAPVILRTPIIIKRDLQIISPLASKSSMFSPRVYAEELTPDQQIAKYIKSKDWPYFVAIRVAKSENAWNSTKSFDCKRIHANNNGSFDYGIFQINTIHRVDVETIYNMSFEEAMTDCERNIDYAYKMWSTQSWIPWVSYQNGHYLNHTDEL